MRKFKFGKLVRDKIAENIISSGGNPSTRILDRDEFLIELKKKLIEEVQELKSEIKPDEIVKELADLQELIDIALNFLGKSKKDLNLAMKKKIEKAGAFEKRIFIEHVECGEDYKWIKYYLENPDRYPEIKD